jgi:hypothetical protein
VPRYQRYPASRLAAAPWLAPVATRDPLQQPFASSSIWNTPIGSSATYVQPTGIPTYLPVSGSNFTPMPGIDPEHIVLTPAAPSRTIAYSSAGWTGTSRCAATGGSNGGLPITVPVPDSYVVPSDNTNSCATFLQADGRTISQCQPLARCTAAGNGTSIIAFANVDLYGDGITGSHGGSGLSAYGGSIRLGELRPGQTGMRHALKINVDSVFWFAFGSSTGFRWPADRADSGFSSDYGSGNHGQYSGMLMGALMAIPASVNLTSLGLASTPGMQLAWTLQNYGAYIADSTGGAGFFFSAENGPAGDLHTQFAADWGMAFEDRMNSNTGWTNDVNTCMNALWLVDSNTSSSIGGGGTPRQPPAPPISP